MPALCPSLQTTGTCSDATCPHSHDLFTCDVCRIGFRNANDYNMHWNSKAHKRALQGRSAGGARFCEPCGVEMSAGNWDSHIRGKYHRRNAQARGLSPEQVSPSVPPNHVYCQVCGFSVHQRQWAAHQAQTVHTRRMTFLSYKTVLDDASKDRNGVSISHSDGVDMGIIEPGDAVQGVNVRVTITNTSPTVRLRLLSARVTASSTSAQSFSVSLDNAQNTTLQYNIERSAVVKFTQNHLGQYTDRLEISIEDLSLRQLFVVIRRLKAVVGNRADYELLRPIAPYAPRPRVRRDPESEIVPGVAPEASSSRRPYVNKLPVARVPADLSAILGAGSVSDAITQLQGSMLPRTLNCQTYGRFWKIVIWVEEHRSEHDLQVYDMDVAVLSPQTARAVGSRDAGGNWQLGPRTHELYLLEVPGLAEKRPSVLRGDTILVHPHGTARGRWFEGHVHVVQQLNVGLRFHGTFPIPSASQRHDVHFKLNRIPLQRQHQALDTAFTAERLLFPKALHVLPPENPVAKVRVFNKAIEGNGPQMDAVKAIVNLPEGSAPFVIFGPPGTGKTVTLVESILQFLVHFPNSHVLVTAPSNSAADLVAQRLSSILKPSQLFRYYAPSRPKDAVPSDPDLVPYTIVDRDGHLGVPPLATLKSFRVIVSTCVSASFAHGMGIPRGHFDVIFIDEAGQATEPEIMIAVKTMADLHTNVVLAGDPKQLGPIIRSAIARQLGLSTSYMERLMGDTLYDSHSGHGRTVVKLTNNYRSHEAILSFPNQRFYQNELVACADDKTRSSCIGATVLVNKKFPVVFHAMSGQDEREASSPSFFNISEIQQVKRYIEQLRDDRRVRVSHKDIGVVAPYHAQCVKIRKLLRGMGADDIKVGSVEEFQGQERRVMFLSAVRSSRENVEFDLRHTLGFVANPRRFNVAVTRAQALLIVIGDPNVLSLDPLWRSFLNYVHINGGWTGIPISWNPRDEVREEGGYDTEAREQGMVELDELAARVNAMSLDGEEDGAIERPWRDVE